MFSLFIALAVIVVVAAVVAAFVYRGRQRRSKAIDDILFDVNPLAEWTYSPGEWRDAVNDELTWGSVDDGATQLRISRTGAYFKNGSREF
jgi:hypothetical protein